MSPPKNVKIDPEEQAALREWKALIVGHYKDDIARLQGMEDSVHGFHIEHHLIDAQPTLRHMFHENPVRALELATASCVSSLMPTRFRLDP